MRGKVCLDEGDYLAWSEMAWNLHGKASIQQVRPEEFDTNPIINVFSAEFPSRERCEIFCKDVGSNMYSISSKEEMDTLQDFCDKKLTSFPYNIWLAVDDVDEEGVWKDSIMGQPLNYTPKWAENEPNGKLHENCAFLQNCLWLDVPCKALNGIACQCEQTFESSLKLLGLCKETHIDREYQIQNHMLDIERLMLVGKSTSIEYDQKQELWLMNVFFFNVTGTSRAPHASFTLGKNTWTIAGDNGCGKNHNSYTTDLKMSGCKDGNFTCYNGQCISMRKRCDQVPNCRDHSDERGCNILVLEEGYNKRVPPVGKNEEDKLTPVTVNVSMTLLKVVDIKEEDYSIKFQIQITLEWKEIRATYHNLKPETYLNALSLEEIRRLWLPLVVYMNTDQQETTRLGADWEWRTYVSVKREGNFTRSGYEMVDETEIFKGNENTLVMTQSYTLDFQCTYQLERYPFDTQVINTKLISCLEELNRLYLFAHRQLSD